MISLSGTTVAGSNEKVQKTFRICYIFCGCCKRMIYYKSYSKSDLYYWYIYVLENIGTGEQAAYLMITLSYQV
jgi:hypothetical protein